MRSWFFKRQRFQIGVYWVRNASYLCIEFKVK